MKVFFSWSGERSHTLAKAFRDWLPNVLQAIDPWISSADITAGSRWQDEIALQLKESRVGIIFLTPENVSSPWLLYEVGALSRALEMTYVCPYLFGFSPSELQGPLVQFQATKADKDGTYSLIRTLNRALGQKSIEERRLEKTFLKWWPDLEIHFQSIQKIPVKKVELEQHKSEAKQNLEKALMESQPKEIVDLLQQVLRKLSGPEPSESPTPEASKNKESVFIVHGHNEAVKEAVARFIEKLGPAVIILHEQPNEGRTIIEKFEFHSAADYSVVLLTGDDAGAIKDTPKKEITTLRARQNVIFELGFFAAKLGRSRISVLYEEGVEIPSDFSGILYIPIDSEGAWRFKLAKELKTAGLKIDLNNAI
jgi:predicted nucleotide-binding protein